MHNHDQWRPTKYVNRNGHWQTSTDRSEVGVASRIIADLVVQFYEQALPKHASGKLLDLGCGKAPLLGIYRPFVTEITTMDWAQVHGAEFVDICHDIREPLPLDDSSFDTVVLSDVLEHMAEPSALLSEIHRILRPQGKLLINVPFYYWLHETPNDFFRFTRFGLAYLAAKSQFEIVYFNILGGAPEVLLDLIGKMLSKRKLIKGAVNFLPVIYHGAMRFSRFRQYARNSAESFPLAYGIVLIKRIF